MRLTVQEEPGRATSAMPDVRPGRPTVTGMRRTGFTLLELIVTFCLLSILSLAAFAIYSNQVSEVSEASGRSVLEVAVVAQDNHRSTYGSYAEATSLEVEGVVPIEGPATEGELSVHVDASGDTVGMAVTSGKLCITVAISDEGNDPRYATFDRSQVSCDGVLALEAA